MRPLSEPLDSTMILKPVFSIMVFDLLMENSDYPGDRQCLLRVVGLTT